jgi:hypothetical protein
MSLLTICQTAADRITGIPRPSSIIYSTDQTARELLSFAQQSGDELMKRVGWQALETEFTLTTTATAAQPNSIPADWDRFVNGSMYNRTQSRKVNGPISAQDWQAALAYSTTTTLESWFRMRGGQILLTPTPPAGNTIAYEYISNLWILDTDGETAKATWEADTDTSRIPEALISAGIKWRWLKSKGLEWMTSYEESEDQITKATVQQKGAAVLSAGTSRPLSDVNIPENGFG